MQGPDSLHTNLVVATTTAEKPATPTCPGRADIKAQLRKIFTPKLDELIALLKEQRDTAVESAKAAILKFPRFSSIHPNPNTKSAPTPGRQHSAAIYYEDHWALAIQIGNYGVKATFAIQEALTTVLDIVGRHTFGCATGDDLDLLVAHTYFGSHPEVLQTHPLAATLQDNVHTMASVFIGLTAEPLEDLGFIELLDSCIKDGVLEQIANRAPSNTIVPTFDSNQYFPGLLERKGDKISLAKKWLIEWHGNGCPMASRAQDHAKTGVREFAEIFLEYVKDFYQWTDYDDRLPKE